MAVALEATCGGPVANSYETVAEAQEYFDTRLPLAGWDNATAKDVLLMMGTRVLDAMGDAHTTLRVAADGTKYIYVSRYWTGSPASTQQRLAWPRLGMRDRNGNPLDFAITSIEAGSPAIVTTDIEHRLVDGEDVLVLETGLVDGPQIVTVLSPTTFSVSAISMASGIGGRVATIPRELKEALAELAGLLGQQDLTLDNPVILGGITSAKAGSVSVTFSQDILAHVLPGPVLALLPASWLTEESIEPASALMAQFDVVPDRYVYEDRW